MSVASSASGAKGFGNRHHRDFLSAQIAFSDGGHASEGSRRKS